MALAELEPSMLSGADQAVPETRRLKVERYAMDNETENNG